MPTVLMAYQSLLMLGYYLILNLIITKNIKRNEEKIMKLRKKLLLSCAALAACATTMVSTTYAWYTSNTQVTSSAVSGSSASSGSALLLISKDNQTWGTTCTPTMNPATALTPLTANSTSKALNTLNYTTGEVGTQGTDQSGYAAFTLYFKLQSTEAAHLYVKSLTVTNTTTGGLPSKSVIGDNWSKISSSDTVLKTYTVDMLRALKLKMEVTKFVDPAGDESVKQDGDTITTIYDISTLQTFTASTDTIGTNTTYDAHAYLKAVMNKSTWTLADAYKDKSVYASGASVQDSVAWDLGELPTAGTSDTLDSYYQVVFKFYLDGAHKACFDACQGQTFSVAAAFTTTNDSVLKIA